MYRLCIYVYFCYMYNVYVDLCMHAPCEGCIDLYNSYFYCLFFISSVMFLDLLLIICCASQSCGG